MSAAAVLCDHYRGELNARAEAVKAELARRSFWHYRLFMRPKMRIGWWQQEVAAILQQFYHDLVAGLRPKTVIQAPPQHGKSEQITDFIGWLAGKLPDLKTIYTSFSERLGIRANLSLQRQFDSRRYKLIFPDTRIPSRNAVTISSQKLRNREIIEYLERDGYFRNTTVGGSITGESLDLGVIDDPIRGRKDANSETTRNSVWGWFTDDFFTRFSEQAGMIAILTRWHIDDPIGRLIAQSPDSVKVFSYPAIAVEDEKYRKIGEPLFPEHKSLDFLLERKVLMPPTSWESLYQQNPIIADGNLFRYEWFRFYRRGELPRPHEIDDSCLSWDCAFEGNDDSDYVAGGVWIKSGARTYLLNQTRAHLSFTETIKKFKEQAKDNPTIFAKLVERKANGHAVINTLEDELEGIIGVEPKESKISRANAVTPLFAAGNVWFPHPDDAPWVKDLIAEFLAFPNGANDDQVDQTTQALMYLYGSGLDDWERAME